MTAEDFDEIITAEFKVAVHITVRPRRVERLLVFGTSEHSDEIARAKMPVNICVTNDGVG